MKHLKYIFAILLTAAALTACNDDNESESTVTDEKTQPITDYRIQAINGGAEISYTLPNDPNILYVMAEYERNGKVYVERSSLYNNTLKIEGFNTLETVTANLYTINYFERRSDPVQVSFTPLESPIMLAYNSLKKMAGFGGIYLEWENTTRTELAIHVMTKEEGEWVNQEVYFSSMSEGKTFREYEDVPTEFGISIEDKWGNVSDTTSVILTPMPETEAWPLSHRMDIPYDKTSQNAKYVRTWLYDHQAGDNSWLSLADDQYSSTFTIDLGKKFILSRAKFWARQISATGSRLNPYTAGNVPTVLEFYGSDEITPEQLSNKGYWLHPTTEKEFNHPNVEIASPNFTDEWVFLGRMTRERLDLLGYSEDEMYRITDAGEEIMFPVDAKPVRYVRVVILELANGSYPPGGLFQIGELNFWGNNKVSQE